MDLRGQQGIHHQATQPFHPMQHQYAMGTSLLNRAKSKCCLLKEAPLWSFNPLLDFLFWLCLLLLLLS